VRLRTTREVELVSGTGESPAAKRAQKALYEARLKAGKTQEEAGTSRSTSTISRWESGGQEPRWDVLDAYAHELGQSISLWFGPDPTVKETAPPGWAEQLERKLDILVARAGVDPVDLEDEEEARRLIDEALRLMQREQGAAER
jgi:transcriptional regulator with XRE-family HTH domain